ncbi:preprotein translocase subunit SecE [Spiroplasma tabanidicola]|uniref:Preprotein translocase subunit SecE n=1 Tax=Spiroplasma tabanidicola TaxID=324079 RepID=A0A6I6CBA4_9MOLU|nr:preprotein translocase subunit SecE [Spiroplasma tabanidicola]QGS51402.1 preprotein translocase subunit SecE [Spiroplasma tabanidicola]
MKDKEKDLDLKAQKKAEKEKTKALKAEAKAKEKAEFQKIYDALDADKGLTKEEKIKKARAAKVKEHRKKINVKLALKETPIKMLKEINKIKWSGRANLGQKFSWVIIFLLIFILFFYGVDTGLRYLFAEIKII